MAAAQRASGYGGKDDMEHQLTAKLLQDEDRKDKQEEGRRDKQNFAPSMLAAGASMGMTGTTMVIIYYALCSSTMLVINKVALEHVPAPSFVMLCQMGFAACMSRAGGALGVVEVDPLERGKVVKFILVVLAHIGCIFCNMNVLQNSNVETFITFRSSTPLILSICDYLFLGRVLPSLRSWLCLVVLLAGSVGYVLTDTAFKIDAYYWLIAWYLFFIFDVVYVKHVCENVKMTNWGRVFYTNVLTCPIVLVMLPLNGEVAKLSSIAWQPKAIIPLVMSCVMGLGMSHAGYMLRDACTATLFTVVGIICKVVSVIINWMMWDKHATIEGIGFLMMCVLAGTFYQQAPKRASRKDINSIPGIRA